MNDAKRRLNPSIFDSRWLPLSKTRKHLEFIIENYLKGKGDKVLADFGCGDMPYKPILSPFVSNYIGLDLKENKLADIHISPEGKIQLEENSVDIILSTQVLEHVEDPAGYLDESFRVLKNNGQLVISTHGYWIYHPTPFDYWRWTSSGLQKVLKKAGYEIEYFKGILSRPAVGLLLIQDSLIFKIPKFLIPLIAFPFQIMMFLIDKILASQKSRDSDAAIYIAVCKAVKNQH